jgi:esterase/lipase
MTFFTVMAMLSGLVSAHWSTISAVGVSLGTLVVLLQEKSYRKAALVALTTAKEVAALELSDAEKRKKIEDAVYDALPVLKKLASKQVVEQIAEHAFTLIIK